RGLTSPPVTTQVHAPTPSVTLSVHQGPNRQVILSGQVTDLDPGGLTVTISGVASGSATNDSNGSFSVTLTATALGTLTASVTNLWGKSGNTHADLTNVAPVITAFSVREASEDVFVFSGSGTAR